MVDYLGIGMIIGFEIFILAFIWYMNKPLESEKYGQPPAKNERERGWQAVYEDYLLPLGILNTCVLPLILLILFDIIPNDELLIVAAMGMIFLIFVMPFWAYCAKKGRYGRREKKNGPVWKEEKEG